MSRDFDRGRVGERESGREGDRGGERRIEGGGQRESLLLRHHHRQFLSRILQIIHSNGNSGGHLLDSTPSPHPQSERIGSKRWVRTLSIISVERSDVQFFSCEA